MSSTSFKRSFRKLRGYAFDPSLSLQLETADVNNIVYKLEYEPLFQKDPADQQKRIHQMRGEYIEIIDYDPASGVFYPPADLDNIEVMLEEGFEPDVNNPQFHQQMVYAVIMTTIKNFEKALGRKIQWSERRFINGNGHIESAFVERLRVYPHALRQANAFYHPDKKALLFGYFRATPAAANLQMPGSTVFTCLSHDIIAHETTHAILDGLHRRYIEPTHPDTRAFHEAFADIVALFQHFTFPEVLKHQIAKTRGNLESQNLLGQLAQEFGKAVGSYGSLRDAIGYYDEEKKQWVLREGSPTDYQTYTEFHDRGSILVAAVFNAFLSIYKRRVQPILRIATGGSGILPAGELHPDLVNQLATIAAKTAGHVLRICVRALDYCPPIDITFGDYLRAIITADKDMVADDERDYRIAFIEAFQKRGIFPAGLKNMSIESLCHESYPDIKALESQKIFSEFLISLKHDMHFETDRKEIYNLAKNYIAGGKGDAGLHNLINQDFIQNEDYKEFAQKTGLVFLADKAECEGLGLPFADWARMARYEIGNVWVASRFTPDERLVNNVIVTLMQKRGVIASLKEDQFKIEGYCLPDEAANKGAFIFRGGCTLIFDLDKGRLKYAIKKDIADERRMEQQFRYMQSLGQAEDAQSMYFDNERLASLNGPFAFMHSLHHH